MNKKLESIKPYIKFYLQHSTGQPIKDSDIDALCNNNGKMISVSNVGNGYVLVGEIRLAKRSELNPELLEDKKHGE